MDRRGPPELSTLTSDQRARRDGIVAAAMWLMVRHDYERIQMRDVAERAQVALGTLYRYFVSKEHLFAEALMTWAESFHTRLRADPGGGSDLERLRTAARATVTAFERQPRVYGVLLAVQSATDPEASAIWRSFSQRHQATLGNGLTGLSSPNREDVVWMVSAVLDSGLRDWLLGRRSITDVYERTDRAVALLLRAPEEIERG